MGRASFVIGATLFVAMVVVVIVKLSADFLPARHLGIEESAYFKTPDGRARLVLVVRDVALDGMPSPDVRPPTGPGEDAVVELTTALRDPNARPHKGIVTLDLVVPLATHLRVIDRRWGHKEHPEGHRFALRDTPPEGWSADGAP